MTGDLFNAAGLKVNRQILKENIGHSTEIIMNFIKEELKMDIADRMGKAILGIKAQYLNGNQIIVRTLVMKQIEKKHTGQNL